MPPLLHGPVMTFGILQDIFLNFLFYFLFLFFKG